MTFTGAATPSPAILDSSLTLTTDNFDPIASATVQFSAGFLSGDTLSFGAVVGATVGASSTGGGLVSETLTFTDGDTILAQFTQATGALKLTTSSATATTADYQAALRGIEFSDPSGVDPTNGGTDKTRSLTWTVVDKNSNANGTVGFGNTSPAGAGNTATGTSTVTAAITGPILSAGALVTFTENEAPVPLDTGLALSDVNAMNRATVSIGSFIPGEDLLSLSSFAGATLGAASTSVVGGQTIVSETLTFTADNDTILAQFNESTGVMTLTTTGTTTQTVAEFQSALQSVEFSDPNGFDPTAGGTDTSRAISWTVIDTNAAPNNTGSSTSTVHTVHTPVSVPTGATGVLVTYTEGQDDDDLPGQRGDARGFRSDQERDGERLRSGVLRELNRVEEALASYGRALAIDPNSATMLFNRGALCDESLIAARRRLSIAKEPWRAIEPDYPHAFSEAANAALRICDWPRSGRYAAALKKHVIDETSVINPLVFITYCDEPALQLRCSQSYLKDKIPELPSPIHAGGRRRPGKARIAYLSADFHGHATSYLIAELFERQDRKRFELFGISFGADDGGEMRRRLAEAFDHFHDVRGRDDLEVAKLLNELEIDIIVDLKGYTQNSRFGIFGASAGAHPGELSRLF